MSTRTLARSHRKAVASTHASQIDSSWKLQKQFDPVSFNLGAEKQFTAWLRSELKRSKKKALPMAWILSNAAYALDVSIPTIKRYLQKHTADAAPFILTEGFIRLRELHFDSLIQKNISPESDE